MFKLTKIANYYGRIDQPLLLKSSLLKMLEMLYVTLTISANIYPKNENSLLKFLTLTCHKT